MVTPDVRKHFLEDIKQLLQPEKKLSAESRKKEEGLTPKMPPLPKEAMSEPLGNEPKIKDSPRKWDNDILIMEF